ncbi:MAG: cysteine synthase A [Tenericutes bacterium 4572_104]|nr:MAG: cysteine synthase A [Tenericutes bacterium 4572_104]
MKVYNNILETIGNTPLVRLKKVEEKYNLDLNLYAKLESFNPTNSVKARPAYYMIKKLYQDNLIDKSSLIIEATSGNTGIALAMVCAYFGNPCLLVMPETMSKERIDLMKLYGAKIVLTDGKLGMKGSILKAEELQKENVNSIIVGQFSNIFNSLSHYETTAYEIDKAMDGLIDYIFIGVGTGGTISGLARYFKEKDFLIKIIAIEPEKSSVLSGNLPHKHKIEGIGAGFIPEILDLALIDEVIQAKENEAFKYTKELPMLEGISIGLSSGAVLSCAIQYINKYQLKDKNIVMIFPDSAFKYFSTGIFE